MTTNTSCQTDFERQVEFNFLHATEIAALNTLQWTGKGQKKVAEDVIDELRAAFNLNREVDHGT